MALSSEEARAFRGQLDKYKEAKRLLVDKWNEDCCVTLTPATCKGFWPEHLLDTLQPALAFLQEHGLINFGAVRPAPRDHDTTVAVEPKHLDEQESKAISKADIIAKLYGILRTADFAVMSEKKIRAQLQEDLGMDMVPYRSLIRKHVMYVVEHIDERDTLAPLPLSDDEGEASGGGANDQRGAAGSGKGGKSQQLESGKEQPHVVVVGAGLAGLAAAGILQRNGVKVTVLEAQPTPGGRLAKLCSHASSADSAAQEAGEPAPLGPLALTCPLTQQAEASWQTAAAGGPGPSAAASAPWPSGAAALRVLCRQLGITLLSPPREGPGGDDAVTLRPRLYDRAPAGEEEFGPRLAVVPDDVQHEAERLLMELLEDVRRRAETQTDGQPIGTGGAQPHASLAAELDAALSRLLGPTSAVTGGVQQEGEQRGAAASAAAAGKDAADGTGRTKRAAGGIGEAGADGEQEAGLADSDRPAKRGRTGGTEGDAGQGQEAGARNEPAGAAGEQKGGGHGAGGKAEADGTLQGGSGADMHVDSAVAATGTPPPPPPPVESAAAAGSEAMAAERSGGAAGTSAASGRHVRQEVLHALRSHLLPLLELRLAAPLSALAPAHLCLVPPLLPPLASALRSEADEAAAALEDSSRGRGMALLPLEGARRLQAALADGLEIRTGVTVTAVAVTPTGVKVTTSTAGTLTASAALLAVPHTALQSGGIALEPPALPHRTAAAARIGGGSALTLRICLPHSSAPALRAICGCDSLRPFSVAAPSADEEGASLGAVAGPSGIGFVFCPAQRPAGAGEAGSSGEGACWLEAHVGPAAAAKVATLPDDDLQRHAMEALRAAAATASAERGAERGGEEQRQDSVSAALAGPPLSCEVLRWGVGSSAAAAPGRGAAAAAAAAALGAACAHLAPGGDPRDMQLLALPHKGRVFFAGEHTAPEQLRDGLLAALLASGVREAARVLRAVKPSLQADGAAGGKAKAGSSGTVVQGQGLEVGDEPPHQELISAAAAQAAAVAKAAKEAAAKQAAGEAKGRPTQAEEDEEASDKEDRAAAKRRKRDVPAGKGKAANRAVQDDDEEEELEDASGSGSGSGEDEEEGSSEGEGHKKGKARGKKQQDRKGARGKDAKKKRRRGGDVSDDEGGGGSGSSEKEEEGGGRRRKGGRRSERESEREKERKEDAVQLGMLDKQRRQAAVAKLQAERKDVKVVYKAMMAAGYGNLGLLREQMSSCGGLDAKQVMLQALQGSSLQVLALLAGDAAVLRYLRDWLMELCDEPSAEHLLLAELRLLERLPLHPDVLAAAAAAAAVHEGGAEAGAGEGEAGGGGGMGGAVRALLGAVREQCAAHRSKDVKRMAAQVAAAWERRAATAGTGGRGAAQAAVGPSADRPAGPFAAASGSRPPLFNPRSLVALRTTPPPVAGAAPAAAAAPAGLHKQQTSSGARATPPPPGANGSSEGSRLDPGLEAQLAVVKAAAEAARQEAALAAQRRAEVQQEAQAAAAAALPQIATFEDYKRVERGTAGTAGGGGSGTGGGSGGGSGKHRDGGSGGKHHKGSSSSGGSAADLEALKAEVVEYTKQLLKRHHKAGRVTTAGYRLILDKATRKVFETLSASSAGSHGGGEGGKRDLLGSKRRDKISRLVEQYVAKMGSAPTGGVGVGAGSGSGLTPPPPPSAVTVAAAPVAAPAAFPPPPPPPMSVPMPVPNIGAPPPPPPPPSLGAGAPPGLA